MKVAHGSDRARVVSTRSHILLKAALRIVVAWLACVPLSNIANAAETVTYTYDVFGRLTQGQTSGGPANGALRVFTYDLADNRTRYQVFGPYGTSPINITPLNAVANITSGGAVLGVYVNGTSPTGVVTFTEGGVFIGSSSVFDGQASIFVEGLPKGTHTITASYSGDATYAPFTITFSVRVQDLSWLPAVLDLLSN